MPLERGGMSIGDRSSPEDDPRVGFIVARERRRLARELHDGLAQDLAFIVSQSLRIAGRIPDEPGLAHIAAAAERALAESRRLIDELGLSRTLTLSAAIADEAQRLAERAGLKLSLQAAPEIETTAEIEHAVLRIVGEAVSNAARHARASSVFLTVTSSSDGLVVRVSDDGCGFDAARPRPVSQTSGYGLVSMAERARSIGAEMRLDSRPGIGTVVELTVPVDAGGGAGKRDG